MPSEPTAEARIGGLRLFPSIKGWELDLNDQSGWTLFWEHGFMQVAPAHWPWSMAVDVATAFMSRWSAGDIPETEIGPNPGELMRECYMATYREAHP